MNKHDIIPIIILLGLTFGTFFCFVYYHELVHKQIFESYGIESEIDMFYKMGAVTIGYQTADNMCNDQCILAHSINDSVGYHLLVILGFIVVLVFFFYFQLRLMHEEKLRFMSRMGGRR